MKSILRKIFALLRRPIDLILLVIAAPAAYVLLFYRRRTAKLPLTTWGLKKIGIFPIRNHYYEPLFDHSSLTNPLSAERNLPGIDLAVESQLAFLRKLTCSSELIDLKLDREKSSLDEFSIKNPSYSSGDAEFLYQFIRTSKPRKIVEIGSGNSTKIARIAVLKNYSDSGIRASHVCIEPYEMKWLEQLDGVSIIRKRVEDCDLEWASELGAGDLLFIDSSHMIRPQGDVLKEYLEILPQLASGVYVHIHDIFTPRDYLSPWIINEVRFWNEQYLLEAILSNTTRYEVIAALNYLRHHHYADLKNVCPYLTEDREPGSFYIQVR